MTEIGDYAFANCWYLTEITIPESVTKIGAHAFDSCVSLKTVQLSDNITETRYYVEEGLPLLVMSRGKYK